MKYLNKIINGMVIGTNVLTTAFGGNNDNKDFIKLNIIEDETTMPKETIVDALAPDIVVRPGEYSGKPGKRVYLNPNAIDIPKDMPVRVDEKGYYIHEFDINLKLSKAIVQKLEAKGVKVEFQVAESKYQDLNAAGRRAAKTGAPIYLSVHHNYYNENSKGYFFMTNEKNANDAKYAQRLSDSIKNGAVPQMTNRENDGYIGEMNVTGGMINILGEFGFFSNIKELEKIISDEQVDYVSTQLANELYEIIVELN